MWKEVSKTEGRYLVSDDGHVKDTRTGKDRPIRVLNGYCWTSIKTVEGWKSVFMHRLVALEFIPNPSKKREVNHVNGNKSDNRVENLEWVTKSENERHAWDNGLKESRKNKSVGKIKCKPVAKYSPGGELVKVYPSVNAAVRDGYNYACILETIKAMNGRKQHLGFKWAFYNPIDETELVSTKPELAHA